MSDGLNVNQVQVEQDAATIATATSYFEAAALVPSDSKKTLTANEKGKTAFTLAQNGLSAMAGALDKDVENIRSLNVEFEEFDKMMGKLTASGGRNPSIGPAK